MNIKSFFKILLPIKYIFSLYKIFKEDPLGWFQWYCRFKNGRRIPHIDKIQIKRWRSFRRHVAAIKKNCDPGDIHCRKKQRQAILQWAYNPFI